MKRAIAALFLPFLLGSAPNAAQAPQRPGRIVSLNLCADQFVLALADPEQIAALTVFSRDKRMSAAADKAASLPVSKGSAEDVLALRPDLIIASPYRRRETMARLEGHHIPTLDIDRAEDYPAIVEQVRAVAKAVGHPERGEALIARMDARLKRLSDKTGAGKAGTARSGNEKVAAYYQRRGFLTGTGTLIDDLMKRVGLVNLAAKLDKPALSRVSLEQIALARPDFLLVETASAQVTDRGTEMLHHPLLASLDRLSLPQAWTVCGGPAYVLAAESLARQVTAHTAK